MRNGNFADRLRAGEPLVGTWSMLGEPVAVEHMILHAMVSGHGFDIEARRYLVPHELGAILAESR